MAKHSQVPAEHRETASRFRHLAEMPVAEVVQRSAHVRRIEDRCPVSGELVALTHAHTKRLCDALPVGEMLVSVKHLHDLADAVPGSSIDSPAHDYRKAAAQLRAENMYEPGLARDAETYLGGGDTSTSQFDLPGIVGHLRRAT